MRFNEETKQLEMLPEQISMDLADFEKLKKGLELLASKYPDIHKEIFEL